MAFTVGTKVRVGFSLALVAFLAIGGSVAGTYLPFFHAHDAVICIGVALAGTLMWLLGGVADIKSVKLSLRRDALPPQAANEHPLACFKNARHWGIILLVSAGLVYSVNTYRRGQRSVRPATPRVRIPKAKPAVSFPPLKLQGLILDGAKSSALIDGQVVRIGEGIGKVRVVAIDSGHVTVELEGATKALSLPN